MPNYLNRITISYKLGLCFFAIIVFSMAFSIYSVLSQKQKAEEFESYKAAAAETLLLADVLEDTLEARLEVMKYRLNADPQILNEVTSNIEEILEQEEKYSEIAKNETKLEQFINGKNKLADYESIFFDAVSKLGSINGLVSQLDRIGPSIRKDLSEIMETAFRDGDPVAAFYAGQTQQHLLLSRLYASKFVINSNANDSMRFNEESQKALEIFETLISELQNPARLSAAQRAQSGLKRYIELFNQTVTVTNERNQMLGEQLDNLGPQILRNYEELLDQAVQTQNTLGPKIRTKMGEMISETIIASALVTIIGVLIAAFFSRYLSQNLKRVTEKTSSLASGDTSVEISGVDRQDEIGSINRALAVFKDGIQNQKELEQETKRAAERSKAEKIELMNKLADNFEKRMSAIVQSVNQASSQLNQTAGGMLNTITHSGERISQSTADSSEASNNVQSVATAAEEMAVTGKEISQQIHLSNEIVENSVNLTGMADKQASKLNEATVQVSSVVKMISEIASEINLLALNATIESARAGDAGKGFAVVANEVKNLASQTDKSIQQINSVIGEMVTASRDIIGFLEEINKSVSTISETSGSIASAVEEQSATTSDIVKNMHVAAEGTQSITNNLKLIDNDAHQTQSAAQDVTSAASELKSQAEGLELEVNNFLKEIRSA